MVDGSSEETDTRSGHVRTRRAGERKLFGPDIVTEAEEKVRIIRDNLKIAQSRQKSYYDSCNIPSMKIPQLQCFVCEFLFNASCHHNASMY